MKLKCNCGAKATYLYGPGYSNNENSSFCKDCVPRVQI